MLRLLTGILAMAASTCALADLVMHLQFEGTFEDRCCRPAGASRRFPLGSYRGEFRPPRHRGEHDSTTGFSGIASHTLVLR